MSSSHFKKPIILYAHPISQPSRALIWFMKLSNIPFKIILIDIFSKAQLTPSFLEMNPNHKIPVIEDPNNIVNGKQFTIYESSAIIFYLSSKLKTPSSLLPKSGSEQNAHCLQYLFWQQNHLRKGAANFAFLSSILPHFKPHARIPTVLLRQAERELKNSLKLLESHWLGGQCNSSPNNGSGFQGYILGSSPSVCDIFAYSELASLWLVNKGKGFPLDNYPNIQKWLTLMKGLKHHDLVHSKLNLLVVEFRKSRSSRKKISRL